MGISAYSAYAAPTHKRHRPSSSSSYSSPVPPPPPPPPKRQNFIQSFGSSAANFASSLGNTFGSFLTKSVVSTTTPRPKSVLSTTTRRPNLAMPPAGVDVDCSGGKLSLYSRTYHRGDQLEVSQSQPWWAGPAAGTSTLELTTLDRESPSGQGWTTPVSPVSGISSGMWPPSEQFNVNIYTFSHKEISRFLICKVFFFITRNNSSY